MLEEKNQESREPSGPCLLHADSSPKYLKAKINLKHNANTQYQYRIFFFFSQTPYMNK